MEETPTVEEVIALNTQDTLTPSPKLEPTDEQKAQITVLLNAGFSPCDIFTQAFLPIEWSIAIEAEWKASQTEELPITPEE